MLGEVTGGSAWRFGLQGWPLGEHRAGQSFGGPGEGWGFGLSLGVQSGAVDLGVQDGGWGVGVGWV